MKFCVGIPAIVDDDIISKAVQSHIRNICNVNKEVCYIVNVDGWKYSAEIKGTLESCEAIYRNIEKAGKELHFSFGVPAKGLALAYRDIMKKFLTTDADVLVFFDDDHSIINPLNFEDVPSSFYRDEEVIIHFANTYYECSSENPFMSDILVENEKIQIRKNKKNFYTQPGTCFSRMQVEKILENYVVSKPKKVKVMIEGKEQIVNASPPSSEDIVSGDNFYKSLEVLTVTSKNQREPILSEEGRSSGFVIPAECHFSCDTRRYVKETGSDYSIADS